jgi:hypothetical protein
MTIKVAFSVDLQHQLYLDPELLKRPSFNPLTPELNPSAQRCLTRFFNWGFCFFYRAFL